MDGWVDGWMMTRFNALATDGGFPCLLLITLLLTTLVASYPKFQRLLPVECLACLLPFKYLLLFITDCIF